MTIAIDYDGTYTETPFLWSMFIMDAQRASHRIICVTARPACSPVDVPCETFYTSGAKKRAYMQCQGVKVDVWIDDRPEDV